MTVNTAVTDTNWGPNFDPGRPYGDPLGIVIHHWGNDGQSHDAVASYLARHDGNTSAHYVASAGRVTQLVHDYDRAWHCFGNNARTIGIECRPECDDDDFETVAQLIAAIRDEWGDLSLSGHQDHYATACPGRWQARLAELDARAQAIQGGSATPTPPAPGVLAIDGWWGCDTTRALQARLGTPVDGIISRQETANRDYVPAAGTGWEWSSNPDGSQAIAALQARLGVPGDGIIGPQTIIALQARLGVPTDGYAGMATVAALQTRLNEGDL
nr:MAG TPA: N-acetylmuramoyl-L-alanine amidase [Caudoviricetes sp.]